jgi:hypothetical protein
MRIEIPCGLMVPSALRLALEEANRIGSRVQFKINGVDMEVAPSSDINDVFWSYDRKREVLCSGNRSR